MNLYEITNGYTGFSYVRCLVVADSDERAKELAIPKFKEAGVNERQNERYWTNLDANLLIEDLSGEYVGEVND